MKPIITITFVDEERKVHTLSLPDSSLAENSFSTIQVQSFNWHGKYAEYFNNEMDNEVMATNRWLDLYKSIELISKFDDYELEIWSLCGKYLTNLMKLKACPQSTARL